MHFVPGKSGKIANAKNSGKYYSNFKNSNSISIIMVTAGKQKNTRLGMSKKSEQPSAVTVPTTEAALPC